MAYYSLAMLTLAVRWPRGPGLRRHGGQVPRAVGTDHGGAGSLGLFDPEDGFFYDRLTHASGASIPIKVQTLVGVIPALPAISVPREPSSGSSGCEAVHPQDGTAGRSQIMDWRVRGTGESRRLLLSIVSPDRLGGCSPDSSMRTPSCLRTACGHCRGTTPSRTACPAYRPQPSTTSPPSPDSDVRGKLQLAWTRLVPRELPGDPGPAPVRPVPRVGLHDRVPGRIWTRGHAARGGRRPRRPAGQHLASGLRRPSPVYGGVERMQTDPAWKDNLLFYEYFHGDNGAGLGAMHQTGWTALVADLLLDPPGRSDRFAFSETEQNRRPEPGRAFEGTRMPVTLPGQRTRSSTRSTPGPGWRPSRARASGWISATSPIATGTSSLTANGRGLADGVWQRSPAGVRGRVVER